MGKQDVDKKKIIPTRVYICCPVCAKKLIQAELVKNAVMKCDTCRNYIFIEVENGRITAKAIEK